MSDDFFVVLPSNASKPMFPNNKINNYTVKLEKDLKLQGYSVALTEIQYPATWYDIPQGCYFTLGLISGQTWRADVDEGNYGTINALVKYINDEVFPRGNNQVEPYDIYYDPKTMKVTLQIWRQNYFLQLSDALAEILGFHDAKSLALVHAGELAKLTGDAPADLTRGMTSLFVYSSVVLPQLVGDTTAELLRCVPIKNKKKGGNHSVEFLHPMYLPTKSDTTSLIEVVIRRDNGELVPFLLGKVVLTLHFKRTL